jgi:hypothetical protein
MTFICPKINDNPAAMVKSNMLKTRPLRSWMRKFSM